MSDTLRSEATPLPGAPAPTAAAAHAPHAPGSARPHNPWPTLAGLVLVAAALAWGLAGRGPAAPVPGGVGTGQWVSVTLVSGQVYYGRLAAATPQMLTLENVYYVQTEVDPATNQRANRLVSRARTDWHAPEQSGFATEKLVMVERVGARSRLLQLIEQDQSAAAAAGGAAASR